ncbi:MAG: amino acid adenylation domain-containing protein, partial [Ferruginibacter sp.]
EEKRPMQLAPLAIQYADFAIWQRNYLQGDIWDEKINYWKNKLQGVTPLQLPVDYPRPAIQSTRGAISTFKIDKEISDELTVFSRQQGVSLFMTLLSAIKVLLHRYSGQQDICVGTAIANRTQHELEELIGFFVNTLALRSEVNGEASFIELLQQVKTTTLDAYSHQDVPFEKVVNAVVKERDMSRTPLFQVMFVLQNTPEVPKLKLGELSLSRTGHEQNTSKFDIGFTLTETPLGLQGVVQYCSDLYNEQTIGRMMSQFTELLASVIKQPHQKTGLLSMLTQQEEQQLIVEFNNTTANFPKDKTIVDLFEAQVLKTPAAIALIFGENQLTYQELNQKSNQLAQYLRTKGVKEESLTPICIERGINMIIGILGILKAGGAYVPIDPGYPLERISYMIDDTGAAIVISSRQSSSRLSASKLINIIELDGEKELISQQPVNNLSLNIAINHLAYVIYTSGSTGRPKGVMIEHGSVANLVNAQSRYFNISDNERILQFSNYSFDASVEQIFLALLNGASLVLFAEGLPLDIELFAQFLNDKKVSHLHATPLFLENLPAGNYPKLKRVIAGGDVCRKELSNRWNSKVDFYNEYGPTETTVTAIEFHDTVNENNSLSIGRPLSNISVYILNEQGSILPLGATGEIYIGGVQVARGYVNRPDLTAERFIKDPFSTVPGA